MSNRDGDLCLSCGCFFTPSSALIPFKCFDKFNPFFRAVRWRVWQRQKLLSYCVAQKGSVVTNLTGWLNSWVVCWLFACHLTRRLADLWTAEWLASFQAGLQTDWLTASLTELLTGCKSDWLSICISWVTDWLSSRPSDRVTGYVTLASWLCDLVWLEMDAVAEWWSCWFTVYVSAWLGWITRWLTVNKSVHFCLGQ